MWYYTETSEFLFLTSLDGCPMFAPAYMGRKRIFPMLSILAQRFFGPATEFFPHNRSVGRGLRRVLFVPCTLLRTWGTRLQSRFDRAPSAL